MFKSIVFDLDGTLINSPLCFDTIRTTLDLPKGHPILEALALLPPAVQTEKNHILEQLEIAAAQKSVLMEGALTFLLQSKQARINIGIFTRNCRSVTDIVMRKFNLPIDAIITRNDAKPKPDPQGLNMLLARWNNRPEELLYVGDYHFDIQCGKQAGVKTALFTNGSTPESDFGADYVTHSYADLASQLTLI